MKNVLLTGMKSFYLFLVEQRSKRPAEKNDKIIFLLSFPSTSRWVLSELYKKYGSRLVVCYTENSHELAANYQKKGCLIYGIDSFRELLSSIPLMKGASTILCDNYFAFLGGMMFEPSTKVIQIWHAGGAVKTFGLEANYAKNSTKKDQDRYQQVYDRLTHYVVASDQMATIFKKSYHVTNAEFLPFGYFPADRYFDEAWLKQAKQKFQERFGNKKSLLYVPTYRENENENPIDFSRLAAVLGDEWQLFAKAHPHDPALQQKFEKHPAVITDFKGLTLQEMLPSIDCLITDYSSVPFEYTLANKEGKLLFFCYDLEEYQKTVGIQDGFFDALPEALAVTFDELLEKAANMQAVDLDRFDQTWNQYNKGNAMKQLMNWMEENEA
ncbi:CDP-glycerol glycerophosphotransferase family protein [Enterococcus sp. JM9B]|uniref:CDP-glycerol glycerophosphotransferase family protein n=1 Tax=Enterococcus sp. JM9B TaxID=1857216 RepID=UPI001374BF0D|nr:CDP-glycerol glycerophosphotransferase family protein [Enterococcus sp. JM9B]KAF1304833.1 CDP-glycerol--UDP-pyrophosphoryl-N-acetylglucosaminyl-N-acetylmannosamine glycerophosphotransferase [Enterococcus sp. JM9B]